MDRSSKDFYSLHFLYNYPQSNSSQTVLGYLPIMRLQDYIWNLDILGQDIYRNFHWKNRQTGYMVLQVTTKNVIHFSVLWYLVLKQAIADFGPLHN